MSNDIKIPNSWSVVKLADISTAIQYGYTTSAAEKPVGPRFLRITDIQDNHVDWNTVPFCKVEAKDKSKYLLKQGDIVFARTGATVGKSFLIKEKIPESVFASYLIRVQLKVEIETRYIDYFFKSSQYWSQISESQAGIGQPNVNGTKLAQIQIPIAPLNEQKLIVAEIEKQFSRLDEAVANLKRVKANLKRYKAAVLKAAVDGRLVETEAELARREGRTYESGEQLLKCIIDTRRSQWKGKGKYKEPAAPDTSNLPELPEGWVWATVEALSMKVADGVHKKPNYVGEGVPFVTVKNLTAGVGISFENLNYVTQEDHEEFCKRTKPERGDILISKDGTLGVVRLVETDRPFSVFVSVVLVKPVMYDLSRYLVTAFESPVVQRQMVPKGSGLQHIHLEDLRADCIPIPPLAEQHRIVAEVARGLSIIGQAETRVDINLKREASLRQSVLKSAFSGTII